MTQNRATKAIFIVMLASKKTSSLSKGNSMLRPLEGAWGTPSACPVSET